MIIFEKCSPFSFFLKLLRHYGPTALCELKDCVASNCQDALQTSETERLQGTWAALALFLAAEIKRLAGHPISQ
jgi:hypothetical protein